MATPALSRERLLAEAYALLNRSPYQKEDHARVEALLQMADSIDGNAETRLAHLRVAANRGDLAGTPIRNLEARRFFAGSRDVSRTRQFEGGAVTEYRDMATTSDDTSFGTSPIIAAGFAGMVIAALKQIDGLFYAARWLVSKTGAPFPLPNLDDTAASASVVGEALQSSEVDIANVSGLQFGEAIYWRSGMIKASLELLQDSGIDIEDLFATAFAIRFARGIGANYISTLLANADTGVTTASPTAIAPDELFTLMGSLDAAYAANGSWLMNFGTFVAISKLKATTNTYLFPMELDEEGFPLLLTKRVYISPSMPAISAGNSVLAFGDLSRFISRTVQDSFSVHRYNERFIDFGQLAFEAFWRCQGALLKAGANGDSPIKLLVMHS